MKKVFIATILAFCMVGLFAVNASAAAGFYTCTIEEVGAVRVDEVIFYLTDDAGSPAFTNKNFTAKAGREKEMLAVGLTAMSMGWSVKVWTDPDLPTLGERIIHSMFLQPQ